MSSLKESLSVYPKLFAVRSYRRSVGVTLLTFFGATATLGQIVLWVLGISGGAALTYTVIGCVLVGVIFALRASLPSADILFRHPTSGSTVRLLVGNLFDAPDRAIVITMNRYFDTTPEWVSKESLVGQLLRGPFAGRDQEFRNSILGQLQCETEKEHPVGEIVSLDGAGVSYLFLAVADRNEETRSTVAVDAVWESLSRLWRYARRHNLAVLRMPVIGSGYARARVGLAPMLVLLLSSYLTSAMEAPICDLEIVLHPSIADPDLLELTKAYCETLGYKSLDKRPFTEADLSPCRE
jgi:Thoeris protein ThsA, Macro domain